MAVRTTRARLVKGRAPKPVVMVSLERHADKKRGTRTGLSGKGIRQARRKGKSFPRHLKSKAYASPQTRAVSSARFGLQSANASGRKVYPKGSYVRTRKELGLVSFNLKVWDKLSSEMGSEERLMRKWLDGKYSKEVGVRPETIADRILRKRFGLGLAVRELGGKDILLRNLSHVPVLEAVFERLTGRQFQLTNPKGTSGRPTETLTISFTRKGRAILSYRGKRYDVTSNLTKIVGDKKLERIAERAGKTPKAQTA